MNFSTCTTEGSSDKEKFGYFRDNDASENSIPPSSATGKYQEQCIGILPSMDFGSLIQQWWTNSLWPGMGLFGESYLLFSIGTLAPLWRELYPDCWVQDDGDAVSSENEYYAYTNNAQQNDSCSPRLLESLTYGVVLGVIFGMVLFGYWSNNLGRRKGSIFTASLMAGGSLGLLVVSVFGSTRWSAENIFRWTVGCLVLFGIGVGGEYPLSASLASEKATEEMAKNQKLLPEGQQVHGVSKVENQTEQPQNVKRGRRVQLVFAMQGMGIWFNSLTMLVLLWALTDSQNGDGDEGSEYDTLALLTVWRVTYGIGALVLCFVLLTRIWYLEESKVWLDAKKANNICSKVVDSNESWDQIDNKITASTLQTKHRFRLVHEQYGSRMFGAGMAWLLWDISFYGNKLFQSTFLLALVGDNASLTQLTGAAALNATVALIGYYGAAILIDLPANTWYSFGARKNLQSIGLVLTGILFFACGWLASLSSDSFTNVSVTLYLISSLVGQLGPNCTTFLIPAEIVPTDQRTYCHGVCAAAGKIGALIAAVVFHFVGNDAQANLFYLCGGAGVLGALVTHAFVPETAGLDLLELDVQWKALLVGVDGEANVCYDGPAVQDQHLSLYERYRRRKASSISIESHNGLAVRDLS